MTRHRELERKFDATPGTALPDLSAVVFAVGEPVLTLLRATYFDTANAALARASITLRRRTGGDDAGWHLKLPVAADERTEVRLPLGDQDAVPAALLDEVRAVVGDETLTPVAVLATERTERRLLGDDGTVLAALADDTVRAERLIDGTASSWREVEVELADGDRAVLDAVGAALLAAGLTPSASSSKLARVLGTP